MILTNNLSKKRKRRDFLKTMALGAGALMLPGSPITFACGHRQKRPNFVFFLVDDLGWVDTGVYGSTFYETANIDRLASEGMLFTDAYAASPVCSPTRASIMTGKNPARLNITNWIGGKQKGQLLPAPYEHQLALEEVTLAEAFKEAGYATGFIGKWHLGDEAYFPEHQGFDINIGGHGAGRPASYFYPYKSANPQNTRLEVPGLDGGSEGEYLTDRITEESLKFIEKNRDRPFLLYLSHYAVHTPIQSKQQLKDRYAAKAARIEEHPVPRFQNETGLATTRIVQDHPGYAGMIQSIDESLGGVMAKLDELGLSENTVVIFMSDNGGLSTKAGDRRTAPTGNVPLRAGKGWLYEGGIREPMIIKWPNVVKAGSVCNQPVVSMDFFPTMLAMADLPQKPRQHVDGQNLVPLLRQKGSIERDAIFWHFPHYHSESGNRPCGAIRMNNYKLVEWFEDGRIEMYDLQEDPGETTDLSRKFPARAKELKEKLADWRVDVDARMPTPNPKYQAIK